MTTRDGIFAGSDPFSLTRRWLDEAQASEPNDPNAIALATVDADGMPNVRIVLIKGIEADAFVFYTNYTSVKAAEMDASGQAAFVMHWKSLRRQVRVRGAITREDGPPADAYYASRSVESRLGAWASDQSSPLESRETLAARLAEARATQGETPPRPPHWGGYRLRPVSFEFWADGAHRLHDRFRWTQDGQGGWQTTRLFP